MAAAGFEPTTFRQRVYQALSLVPKREFVNAKRNDYCYSFEGISLFFILVSKTFKLLRPDNNEPFDDSPTGRLLEAIIESLDEFYSDNLGEDVTRGMRESASRGFYLSPRPPYGYRKIKVKGWYQKTYET